MRTLSGTSKSRKVLEMARAGVTVKPSFSQAETWSSEAGAYMIHSPGVLSGSEGESMVANIDRAICRAQGTMK